MSSYARSLRFVLASMFVGLGYSAIHFDELNLNQVAVREAVIAVDTIAPEAEVGKNESPAAQLVTLAGENVQVDEISETNRYLLPLRLPKNIFKIIFMPERYQVGKLLMYPGPSTRQYAPILDGVESVGYAIDDQNIRVIDKLLSSQDIPYILLQDAMSWSSWNFRSLHLVVPKERYQETISVLRAAIALNELKPRKW